MGFDPERSRYLHEAGTFLGQVHLEEIDQVGEDPEALAQDFAVLPVFDGLKVGAAPLRQRHRRRAGLSRRRAQNGLSPIRLRTDTISPRWLRP